MSVAALKYFNSGQARTYLAEAWNWWLGELETLLPEKTRASIFRKSGGLVINYGKNKIILVFDDVDGDQIKRQEISSPAISKTILESLSKKFIGQNFRNIKVEIRPDLLFQKAIFLPSAFKKNLQQILTLRLEQYFPLGSDNVHFTHRIVRENVEDGTLEVLIWFLRKEDGADIIRFLEQLKIRARQITFAITHQKETAYFETFKCKRLLSGPGLKQLVSSPLTLSMAFWMLLYAGHAAYMGFTEAQLTKRVENFQTQLSQTAEKITDFEAYKTRESALINALEGPNALAVMGELSRLLPLEGWIKDLSLSKESVEISGFHPNPPGIVESLESSPLFESVELLAVRDTQAGPSFRISFDVVKKSGEGP